MKVLFFSWNLHTVRRSSGSVGFWTTSYNFSSPLRDTSHIAIKQIQRHVSFVALHCNWRSKGPALHLAALVPWKFFLKSLQIQGQGKSVCVGGRRALTWEYLNSNKVSSSGNRGHMLLVLPNVQHASDKLVRGTRSGGIVYTNCVTSVSTHNVCLLCPTALLRDCHEKDLKRSERDNSKVGRVTLQITTSRRTPFQRPETNQQPGRQNLSGRKFP